MTTRCGVSRISLLRPIPRHHADCDQALCAASPGERGCLAYWRRACGYCRPRPWLLGGQVELSNWLLYAAAALGLSLTPGPKWTAGAHSWRSFWPKRQSRQSLVVLQGSSLSLRCRCLELGHCLRFCFLAHCFEVGRWRLPGISWDSGLALSGTRRLAYQGFR